jgi:hypothetical protein
MSISPDLHVAEVELYFIKTVFIIITIMKKVRRKVYIVFRHYV